MSLRKPPKDRDPREFHPTPPALADYMVRWAWKAHMRHLVSLPDPLPAESLLIEPSAGEGVIVRALRAYQPQARIMAVEPFGSEPEERAGASWWRRETLEAMCERGGLLPTDTEQDVLVVANPPFSLAEAHLRLLLALPVAHVGVALLTAQSFLAGGKRIDGLRAEGWLRQSHDLCPRPSFEASGATAMTEYCLTYWSSRGRAQESVRTAGRWRK